MADKTVKVVPFSDLKLLDIGHKIQLAGAVYAGDGRIYLMLYPDEQLDQDIRAIEMTTDQWLEVIRQSDLLETEVLAKAPDGSVGKAVIRKSTRQIEQGVSWRVYRRSGRANTRNPGNPCCEYCGADDVPLTVDHMVCWEVGGPSIPENLRSCCRRCNKTRGNMEYVDWLNDPYYRRVSQRLTQAQRDANEEAAHMIDRIPRRVHIASR